VVIGIPENVLNAMDMQRYGYLQLYASPDIRLAEVLLCGGAELFRSVPLTRYWVYNAGIVASSTDCDLPRVTPQDIPGRLACNAIL
jgi:hypothetical protein